MVHRWYSISCMKSAIVITWLALIAAEYGAYCNRLSRGISQPIHISRFRGQLGQNPEPPWQPPIVIEAPSAHRWTPAKWTTTPCGQSAWNMISYPSDYAMGFGPGQMLLAPAPSTRGGPHSIDIISGPHSWLHESVLDSELES